MNRRGLSMRKSAELHPFRVGMININRRRIHSLAREINFEIFEQVSKNHSVKEIPTQNHEVLR